jgi:type III pantothenate kinase
VFSLEGLDWKKLEDVIISSVVPEADFHIKKFCEKYLRKKPILVGLEQVPIKVDLDRPEEVGADRLVNALAIKEFYKVPAIVIDFGTATTFDVIDARGAMQAGRLRRELIFRLRHSTARRRNCRR